MGFCAKGLLDNGEILSDEEIDDANFYLSQKADNNREPSDEYWDGNELKSREDDFGGYIDTLKKNGKTRI